jgi:hypothetical protein
MYPHSTMRAVHQRRDLQPINEASALVRSFTEVLHYHGAPLVDLGVLESVQR